MKFNLNQIYIAVEGLPGSGKNQLCSRLVKQLQAKYVYDDYLLNPFLKDFYKEPEKFDLGLQLCFLIQRYNQQLQIPGGDLFNSNVVANYIFNKDQIYAAYNLDDRKYILYNQLLNVMNKNIPIPDLVIYLHSPDSRLIMENIAKKGRAFEKLITEDYVSNLNKHYNYFFEKYNDTPLLIISTPNLDLDENCDHFNRIWSEIEQGFNGSKYLKF